VVAETDEGNRRIIGEAGETGEIGEAGGKVDMFFKKTRWKKKINGKK
jgi:hypothetical protein